MDAGKLDTRVTVMTRTTSRGSLNSEIVSWSASADKFWAQKMSQRPVEAWKAGQTAAQLEVALRCRWSSVTSAIAVNGRLTFDGKTYEVIGAPQMIRRDEIQIVCVSIPQ